jgi:hypothetical protein
LILHPILSLSLSLSLPPDHSIATLMEEGNPPPLHTEPPPLPYSLHTRKKAIAFFWILFVVDTLGQPLILYWALWYCTDLSHNLSTLTIVPEPATATPNG